MMYKENKMNDNLQHISGEDSPCDLMTTYMDLKDALVLWNLVKDFNFSDKQLDKLQKAWNKASNNYYLWLCGRSSTDESISVPLHIGLQLAYHFFVEPKIIYYKIN